MLTYEQKLTSTIIRLRQKELKQPVCSDRSVGLNDIIEFLRAERSLVIQGSRHN